MVIQGESLEPWEHFQEHLLEQLKSLCRSDELLTQLPSSWLLYYTIAIYYETSLTPWLQSWRLSILLPRVRIASDGDRERC